MTRFTDGCWFASGRPSTLTKILHQSVKMKSNNTTTVLRPFVQDYPGELVPEETLTHRATHHPDQDDEDKWLTQVHLESGC